MLEPLHRVDLAQQPELLLLVEHAPVEHLDGHFLLGERMGGHLHHGRGALANRRAKYVVADLDLLCIAIAIS